MSMWFRGWHGLDVAEVTTDSLQIECLLHVVLCLVQDDDYFHKIPEPTEDELDMLDLAFGLTET